MLSAHARIVASRGAISEAVLRLGLVLALVALAQKQVPRPHIAVGRLSQLLVGSKQAALQIHACALQRAETDSEVLIAIATRLFGVVGQVLLDLAGEQVGQLTRRRRCLGAVVQRDGYVSLHVGHQTTNPQRWRRKRYAFWYSVLVTGRRLEYLRTGSPRCGRQAVKTSIRPPSDFHHSGRQMIVSIPSSAMSFRSRARKSPHVCPLCGFRFGLPSFEASAALRVSGSSSSAGETMIHSGLPSASSRERKSSAA